MQGPCVPHRPENETLLDARLDYGGERFILLRLFEKFVSDYKCGGPEGGHQQHCHSKYDLHEDVAEVWTVVGHKGEHCLWLGVFLGG